MEMTKANCDELACYVLTIILPVLTISIGFVENCNSHLIIVNYGVTMLGSTFTDQNVNRNYKSVCNVMIWCKLLH